MEKELYYKIARVMRPQRRYDRSRVRKMVKKFGTMGYWDKTFEKFKIIEHE